MSLMDQVEDLANEDQRRAIRVLVRNMERWPVEPADKLPDGFWMLDGMAFFRSQQAGCAIGISREQFEQESAGQRERQPRRLPDAELIRRLRQRPYDRAQQQAADRLEELTRPR